MRKGFTIIELLVAITIIGILLAAAGLKFTQARSISRDSKRISDIFLISKSIDSTASQNGGNYPYLRASLPLYGDDISYNVHSSVDCVKELAVDSRMAFPLDKSMFPNGSVPEDPSADSNYAPSNSCLYPEQGYIYENHYTNKTHYPLSISSSQPQTTSMAQVLQVKYVLDVSLENEQQKESVLSQYSASQKANIHSVYTSHYVNLPPLHYRYYLPGPYCGDQCYN